jgi:hypothetical protein
MKLLRIGKTITVVLDDGTVISSNNCTDDLFLEIKELIAVKDVARIKKLLVPELFKEEQEYIIKKDLIDNIKDMVEDNPDVFELKDKALYRIGINLSIPESLAIEYVKEYLEGDDETQEKFFALDNFWMWCSLNPNAESREDLFRFLKLHGMPITKQGMFLAYRRVVSVGRENQELVKYVSNAYFKVKANSNKDVDDYFVNQHNGEYYLADELTIETIGSLSELYDDLHMISKHQFTDAHTRTMNYCIGVEARIPRYEGNQSNNVSCSKGLHVASEAYDYSGFGDTPIVVVVNPMDVLAVPIGEDGKLRTCAFTPIAVLEKGEENKILSTIDCQNILVEHFDEQLNNLKELAEKNSAYELNINNIIGISSNNTLDSILTNLEIAQDLINKRITPLNI